MLQGCILLVISTKYNISGSFSVYTLEFLFWGWGGF